MNHTLGLELNEQKDAIRYGLISQISLMATYSDDFRICTLPASNAIFENKFHSHCNKHDIKNVEMLCAENNQKRYKEAKKNIPSCAKIWNINMDKVLYNKMLNKGKLCDVIWADYCNPLSLQDIKGCVDHIRFTLKSEGMYYVTTNLCGGRIVNGKRGVYNMLTGHNQSSPCIIQESKITNSLIRDEMEKQFVNEFKRQKIKNVCKIYDVMYRGGSNNSTPMLTMGFSIGIKRNRVIFPNVIKENRIHRDKMQKKFSKKNKKEMIYLMIENGCEDSIIMKEMELSKMSLAGYKANNSIRKNKLK